MRAAATGSTETVKFLIRAGASMINHVCKQGLTALTVACKSSGGDTETVKCLIKAGAPVNLASRDGRTPLWKLVSFMV